MGARSREQPISTTHPADRAATLAPVRSQRLLFAGLIAVVALGALLLRVWTIRANLPYVDHPDEPNPIDYVVRMLQTGDPNPHAFQKPSFYVYLLLAALTVHYRLGLASGLYSDISTMTVTTHLFTTIPGFFLWGRVLTATLAALTVIFVYRVGARVWSKPAGLIAALFLALSPFHMRHSQYVTTDVASGLLVLLAFGAAVAVARSGRWRDYLAAGAFAGLAASTKYNAGVAAVMVVAGHFVFWWNNTAAQNQKRLWLPLRETPRLIAAGAAALLGFVVGTPYAALSFDEFRRGLLGQVADYSETAHGDFIGAWNLGGYADLFLGEGLGWIASAAVVLGLGLLLWRQRSVALIWFSFALPYFVLHLAQSSHFGRNMLPLVVLSMIPLGVAGAFGLEQLGRLQMSRAISVLIGLLLIGLLFVPPARATGEYITRQLRGDTRLQMLAWIDANVLPGERIAAEMRSLPGSFESRWAEVPDLTAHDLAWYRSQGYAYLLASSDAWRQWPIPNRYRNLSGNALVAEYGGPEPRWMFGPHLAIYATGLAPDDAPILLRGTARSGGARLVGIALGRPLDSLGVEPTSEFKAGETVALRTFWSVEQPLGADYFIYVHVLDAAGNTVSQRDAPPWQGRFPTSSWRAGSLVVDVNDLALPAQLAPGTYTLRAGMFDPNTGARPDTTLDGNSTDGFTIGQITVQ